MIAPKNENKPAPESSSTGKSGDPAADSIHHETPGTRLEVENGGPAGPEPTRYGDWERKGRCIDF